MWYIDCGDDFMSVEINDKFDSESISYVHKNTRNTDDYVYNMHTHDCFEMLFLEEGEAKYLVEGKSFPIKNNSLVLTRPGDVHCIKINKNSPDHRRAFWFNEAKLNIELSKFITDGIYVVNIEENAVISELLKRLDFYHKHFDGEDFEHILAITIEEIIYNLKIIREEDIYSENPLIKKALRLIEENIKEPFFLDKICSELYISKSYLHRLFIKNLHITPKKYINLKRLSMAQKMIAAGKKPTEAAYLCGFVDYSCFYRQYKKHFEAAPSCRREQETPTNNFH